LLLRSICWAKNNAERTLQIQRNYQRSHPNIRAAQHAKYYQKNKQALLAYTKKWVEENRSNVRVHVRNRRARLSSGKLSPNIEALLLKHQHGTCTVCRTLLTKDMHLDHIMPLALGGANTDDNVQLLCRGCNQRKHAKHPIKFMQEQGYLL
jgi:5-methylcytosine-specific restriction endonuclease McrA